ncbi:DUF2939 domain-containing protein [Croceicoccus bisphenolivorans]|uniref:DUF2939 domain-containing protein n=1 Tax=Croceicoccus bisphenolivorans TaxID=1783232 RepID=UPI0008322BA3|nr:DUF2939 domain-containing protein [Croceicoccus bisphenolivorans]
MKKLLAYLFLIACIAVGWFIGSRLYALHDLREAARAGDVARLEGRVDFHAFRESLKSEVGGAIDREDIGGLGSVLAKAGTSLAVDTLMTPDSVAQLVRTGQAAGVTVAERSDTREPVDWRIRSDGLNAFRLYGEDGHGALVFRRDGLGWVLAGVDLDAR